MKLKKFYLFLALIICPTFFFGQIKVSKNIQKSLISESEENALYFVDFWATWCKPCKRASKYLEDLQKRFPNNFYIVSLTNENPDVVERFVLKHKMKLSVAIDYNSETFSKNNIVSIPHGILFNADGKKLWEGHAATLESYDVEQFLETNKKTISVSSFLNLQPL